MIVNYPKKYKLKIAISLIIIHFLFGCTARDNEKVKIADSINYQEVKTTRVKFNFNQFFEIREVKKGQSISDIHLKGIGFQNSTHTIKFESVDPFENFLIADIDIDEFEEILFTRSVGSGSYCKIIGVASNKGTSYKTIYLPEYDKSLKLTFDYLEGNMGHDSIYIKSNTLFREFPVFKSTDSNTKATVGRRQITYNLVELNNSFSLQVKSHKMMSSEKLFFMKKISILSFLFG